MIYVFLVRYFSKIMQLISKWGCFVLSLVNTNLINVIKKTYIYREGRKWHNAFVSVNGDSTLPYLFKKKKKVKHSSAWAQLN